MKHNRFYNQGFHIKTLWLFLILFLPRYEAYAADNSTSTSLHHQLNVTLSPADGVIRVIDIIHFPAGTDRLTFSLRSSLSVKAIGAELSRHDVSASGDLHYYQIDRLPENRKVQLSYEGKIVSRGISGPFNMPESVFDEANLYLDASSAWLPVFKDYPLFTYELQLKTPKQLEIISQGKRIKHSGEKFDIYRFNLSQPQRSIYLLGGNYQRYTKQYDGIEVVVYLYQSDPVLADNYLETSADYLRLYSQWIGRYPYESFSVVENRWQTGYGMPSFTLLGSQVLRLPFILHSSLPHEILHNWWGNAVYIDYTKGNWSEGLTAYMSDHYTNEQQNKGHEYRRKALERYANFAAEKDDFALSDFRSRHDEASQAIGYSKALMLFHMLRKQSGDDDFTHNLRQFWQQYQFDYASFTDLIQQLYKTHNTIDGSDKGTSSAYEHFVEQWLDKTGAPEISLDNVSIAKRDETYLLTVEISQQQAGKVYHLPIQLDVSFQSAQTQRESIYLNKKKQHFTFHYKQPPQTLKLDPDYDVFRLLHQSERPASLARLFGAEKQLLVMPSNSTSPQIKAWQQLAAAWQRRYKNVDVVFDNDIQSIPDDVSVWLLGWKNQFLKQKKQNFIVSTDVESDTKSNNTFLQSLSDKKIRLNNQVLHAENYAVVLLDADNRRSPLGFIGAEQPEVITAMARKLPHYSSYGQLTFALPEVKNRIKLRLPVLYSTMFWSADNGALTY